MNKILLIMIAATSCGCVTTRTCNSRIDSAVAIAVDSAVAIAVDSAVDNTIAVMLKGSKDIIQTQKTQCKLRIHDEIRQNNEAMCTLLQEGNNVANKCHTKFIPIPKECIPILKKLKKDERKKK